MRSRRKFALSAIGLPLVLATFPWVSPAAAQKFQGRVEIDSSAINIPHKKESPKVASFSLVWLTPLSKNLNTVEKPRRGVLRLTQRNKNFQPHILVVPVGSQVEFPNRDPFFHNVFSLFEGKRFDLGLYEAGETRLVHFDRPGISYIFCNIHSEMSAVVIALDSPYYSLSDANGNFKILLPSGNYRMQVWNERASPESLSAASREVSVTESASPPATLHLVEGGVVEAHKNKYGRDYDLGTASPSYSQP